MKNENLRPLIFTWLNKIMKKNPYIKLTGPMSNLIETLTIFAQKNNPAMQYQTLEVIINICQFFPNALSDVYNDLVKALISIVSNENLQLMGIVYEAINKISTTFDIDPALVDDSIKTTLEILKKIKSYKGHIKSVMTFVETACKKLSKKVAISYISTLKNDNSINENEAKALAIIAHQFKCSEELNNELIKKVILLLSTLATLIVLRT